MDLEQEAAAVRFERAVHRAGRAAGIGAGREALATPPLGVVADGQIAVDEIHFLPIFVHERLGREDARLEAQQPGAIAALADLVEGAGQDLLLDAGGIARRGRPAALHVEAVEIAMRVVDRQLFHRPPPGPPAWGPYAPRTAPPTRPFSPTPPPQPSSGVWTA